jgi:tetratricopeptide (TPR) repeat protein
VQKSNNQVRVTAQLIRAGDGFHVWSQNYTRPLEDIFAIQDEIATDVATALDASLLGMDKRLHSVATSNINAYETYLKALEQQALLSYSSLPRAESLLKDTLAMDPGFTDAKLALVRNYYFKLNTGMIDQPEAEKFSRPLLNQVYATDPDNRLARALELVIGTWIDAPLSPKERREKLLEVRDLFQYLPTETEIRGPVANAIFWELGLRDEALAVIEGGLLVDPMSPGLQSRRGDILADMGRLDEGLAALLRADELSPQNSNILARIAGVKAMQGDMGGSLEWLRRATAADPGDHELAAMLAVDLYNLNLPEAARPWADRVAAQAAQTNMGRKVELVRAYTLDDLVQAERLARSMIADQVSARFNTYGSAVFIFQEILSMQGRDAEGLAYLRQIKPELSQYDYPPQDYRDSLTYLAMASFEYMLQPPEELKKIRQKLESLSGESADFFNDDSFSRMFSAMLLGEQSQASEILLQELLPQPAAQDPGLLETLMLPMFAELLAPPEVQAAINQRQRDTDIIRQQVLEQLQQPEWNP